MTIDNAGIEEWRAASLAVTNAMAELTPRDVEALNLALSRGSFGELPLVTRAYVFLLCQMGKVRVYRDRGMTPVDYPSWQSTGHYRIEKIEPPKTKPSIDWTLFSTAFHWLARDKDGRAYVFASEPSHAKSDRMWQAAPWVRVDELPGYKPGNCDWQDSRVERPA